jgi:heterogeneous nuclear rnp K-like protein 2
MSASPPQPTQSAKRPLEEPSSPSRPDDQPEAKRPALDKVIRNDEETKALDETVQTPVEPAEENSEENAQENGDDEANGVKEPEETPAAEGGSESKAGAATVASTSATANSAAAHDETTWIHIRAVISSPEAATVIGKGGENVSNIRKMSNAKCTVSEYQKGAVERILTVSGIVDAVAKVCRKRPDPRRICCFR